MPRIAVDWRHRERRSERRHGGWQTSGGVVLDLETARVLLVKNKRERREGRSGWTWPKGLIDPGEGPVYAAIREIEEEAGVRAEPLVKLAEIETPRALRHYFLLSLIGDGMPLGRETVKVRWVSLARAKELLDRQRDLRVLRAAKKMIHKVKAGHLDLRRWHAA